MRHDLRAYADAVEALRAAHAEVYAAMVKTFPIGCRVLCRCAGSRKLNWVAVVRGYADDESYGKLIVAELDTDRKYIVAASRITARRLKTASDWEELPRIDMEGEQDEQGA